MFRPNRSVALVSAAVTLALGGAGAAYAAGHNGGSNSSQSSASHCRHQS